MDVLKIIGLLVLCTNILFGIGLVVIHLARRVRKYIDKRQGNFLG